MALFSGKIVHRARDRWGSIEVVEDGAVRSLHFGTAARQSAMSLYEPDYLLLSYTRAMVAPLLFVEAPRRVLLVGLGGGSVAKFLLRHYPQCHIEAVELRPEVVGAARRWFDLPTPPNLEISIGDGAEFLFRADDGGYDLILIDAYDHAGMAPGLGEGDVLAAAARALRAGGAFSLNAWSAEHALFDKVERALLHHFERRVLRLPVTEKGNVILIGLDNALGLSAAGRLKRRAAELDQRLGIGLQQQLAALRRHNSLARIGRSIF
ncbi:spermine/spermidine synthase domain-containing protein [Endothiovibrio diazotrophicus]